MGNQAPRVIRFIEEFLTLGGSFYGEPFKVLPFQKAILEPIYETDDDGRRIKRTALVGLSRKNAKTTLAAAMGVYHLIADDADKAPVAIAAAADRQQARLVHDEVKRMILASPELSATCDIFRNEIRCHRNGGVFRVVSADAGLQHGLNPSWICIDEMHVHKTMELFDALTLGSATRSQPLTVVITTAGWDLESPLGRLYRYGRKVESGEVDDDSFAMVWNGPPETVDLDPHDEENWKRFNPAWDHFLNQEEFHSAHKRTHESAFTRYRLNSWTRAESSWFGNGVFEGCASDRRLEDGEAVTLGFDGAWGGDSTGLVACSLDDPKHLEVIGIWEKPEGVHSQGWRTNVAEVEATLRAACERFSVREVVCDPYRWEQTLQTLADEGLPIIEYPTSSVQRMTSSTQMFYDAVVEGRITHSGEPVLQRHVANAVLREDVRGARITKDRRGSSRKIDLAICCVIAHHRACVGREENVYEPQMIVV